MDPSLISNSVPNQWVVETTKILDHQIDINREIPSVSVFHLPESITTTKPEAYEPQQIGLGPIHHFRSGPYRNMQQHKLVVARKDLQEITKEEDGKIIVINKAQELLPIVRELVPIVRSCYNIFLKDDDESLAMIFAIDGLFLLNLFQTYNIGMGEKEAYLLLLKEKAREFKRQLIEDDPESLTYLPDLLREEEFVVTSKNQIEFERYLHLSHQQFQQPKFGTRRRTLVQDIMMASNQIPFIVLKEIKEGLHPSSGSFSPSEFRIFCKIHSPLKLCSKSQAPKDDVNHVLQYLYDSIVNNYTPIEDTADLHKEESQKPDSSYAGPHTRMGLGDLINPINFISKVPTEEIVQLYEKSVSVLESFSQSETLLVPTASKLHDKAGFMFHALLKHQGIQNIYNKGNDIYLPCISLNNDSEVILRNLVAYETLTANTDKFLLNEYMGLMCALIVNVDDVQLLKDQKVIDGEMGNDEVAKLFIEMSTCIQPITTKEKSNLLQKMIDEVNTVYNNRLEMKMYLLLRKLAGWLLVGLKSIGKFVEHSWKIVAFMIGIVAVFVLTYKAYCDVYECH
uniref:putative UPF0481 protein At3g02645 n=1 Tax=Erigeron canadensis TaxID=72917 RepID=UPI001CB94D96|nr:putative UPF0481 protein At3g02645 [Erigeron canadensis]